MGWVRFQLEFFETCDLVKSIFGDNLSNVDGNQTLAHKVILASKNDDVLALNEKSLRECKTCYSADEIMTEDDTAHRRFPKEFLHKQTPPGMPPHVLKLKVGAIVMLLRNMSQRLCNCSRNVRQIPAFRGLNWD